MPLERGQLTGMSFFQGDSVDFGSISHHIISQWNLASVKLPHKPLDALLSCRLIHFTLTHTHVYIYIYTCAWSWVRKSSFELCEQCFLALFPYLSGDIIVTVVGTIFKKHRLMVQHALRSENETGIAAMVAVMPHLEMTPNVSRTTIVTQVVVESPSKLRHFFFSWVGCEKKVLIVYMNIRRDKDFLLLFREVLVYFPSAEILKAIKITLLSSNARISN